MANHQKSIYSALAANLLIALTKFIAGAFTNSSSMISEGIHSTVDTANQLLLLYGLKRSKKKADEFHPFGYGKELYFWSFVVSVLIFGLGGALSVYQGISHILEPEAMKDPLWNYIVLSLSLIFEGSSLYIAVKEFNKTRNGMKWWDAIVKSKDPSSFLVVFEDGAAVAGLIVVMILMGFSHACEIPELDGLASVIVGLILVFVSFILARESRSLLMGEGIAPETREKIAHLAEKDSAVIRTKSILSTYQSPEEVVLMLIIGFEDHLDTEEITEAIQRIRESIKNEFPLVRFVIIQPE
ncbi:cation diffusion facilitator family transporter [Chryseobacterium sp. GMJ5]|uniref:Cation diffusion facilitator family transporter n=1 Tax=Chryseobacterium gilvum TaxID=2976534 RepID=A0ABT2VV14_9FLAO|nr:cation diffusion facilitator family transporter [Chryseobacterium gilvum]MCU7613448.1 cation diffusion facilitator family transporter [Chryseobacterium gilvum]